MPHSEALKQALKHNSSEYELKRSSKNEFRLIQRNLSENLRFTTLTNVKGQPFSLFFIKVIYKF